eukprot:scaffold2.g7145.t1
MRALCCRGKRTFDHYMELYRSPDAGTAGVILTSAYQLWRSPQPDPVWRDIVPHFHHLSEQELKAYDPTGLHTSGWGYVTVITEGRYYMAWLLAQLRELGVREEMRRVTSPDELSGYDLVVNATGLGARDLWGDDSMYPVRGQVMRVRAPWIRHYINGDECTAAGGNPTGDAYIIPNSDTVVLGGTLQQGDWDTSLAGAALGAGATTAYLKPEALREFALDATLGPRSTSSSKEIAQLQKLVEQLARDVHTRQPVTIVHAGSERSGSYVLYAVLTLGCGTVLYLKFYRGWSVGDLMYVTRRGLRQGLAQVSSGIEALGKTVADVKAKLQARIAELSRKQDETIAAQAALKQQLGRVGADVEVTRGQVGQIHGLVLDMEATMSEGSNIPSKAELIEYTKQHPVWAQGDKVQGLEGVLRGRDENSGAGARGPFLLRDSPGGFPRVASPSKVQTPAGSEGRGDDEGASPGAQLPPPPPPTIAYPVYAEAGTFGLRTSTLGTAWPVAMAPLTAAAVDDIFLAVINNVPQLLLVVLCVLIGALILKDILNGLRRPFLNPDAWQKLPLVDIKALTHNTKRFRFALPHEDQQLGLPVGQHVSLRGRLPDGEEVMRAYTPVSDIHQRGHVDFVIKLYPDGKMSRVLAAMKVGDTIDIKGPKGRFKYSPGTKRALGMLAGGSGITPMYQLTSRHTTQHNCPLPPATHQMSLIFGNVYHVLNQPPKKGWKGGSGFISAAMIKEHLPPPGDSMMVLRCGPSPMNKAMEARPAC